jgi:hypothetical protein
LPIAKFALRDPLYSHSHSYSPAAHASRESNQIKEKHAYIPPTDQVRRVRLRYLPRSHRLLAWAWRMTMDRGAVLRLGETEERVISFLYREGLY